MIKRARITVRGIVQGVGFRPFVFSLARRYALRGRVLNDSSGVLIYAEGDPGAIRRFTEELRSHPPPLARVESVESDDGLDPAGYEDFRIVESRAGGEEPTHVSPDIATCADCLRELFDPQDRRHLYPFINCTACGPRFTIVEATPYDRERTTMRDFGMCAACRAEYEDPRDRRFHAEPTACPACGPRLTLADAAGLEVCRRGEGEDVIARTRDLLLGGKIVAVKGIGGFHLACDALDAESVERLRRRKYREDKPFAMMAESPGVVRRYCLLSDDEESLLLSGSRPVVLLEKRPGAAIPESVAPGVGTFGFMLPYAPLHHLLLAELGRPLVMTSGNVSDEPICYEDGDALSRLREIADYFLLHGRRIHTRADDSIARAHAGRAMLLRRARGYAPAPVGVGFRFAREVLACGAELKNTFCFGRGSDAFVSHHIGDLENLETLRSFTEGVGHFGRLFRLRPEVVAYDLHPEYLSTKYALSLEEPETKIGVQHHHAHVASCMADNRIEGAVIGVAMDGLGFGADGRLWGGEFFVADFLDAERVAHLDYVPMPGGAQAVREPWRMAATYLHRAFGDDFLDLDLPFVRSLDRRTWAALRRMARSGTNSPETSSMGRLFDAVAALLSLRGVAGYEGQAAIELEALAAGEGGEGYEFELTEDGSIIGAEPVIRRAVEDILAGVPPPAVSAKFHESVARLIGTVAVNIRDGRRLNRVALSGGVFQNVLLLNHTRRLLLSEGFEVFTHGRVPPNDGGLSLGQAAVANARVAAGRI